MTQQDEDAALEERLEGRAKEQARNMLFVSTQAAQHAVSRFADWLMLASVGAFALMLSKWSDLTNFVHVYWLHWALALFVLSLVAGIAARVLRFAVEVT